MPGSLSNSGENGYLDGRFDAVLFDLGSTLIYFDANWREILPSSDAELLRSLKDAGLELDETAFLSSFRAQLGAYFTERETEFIEYTTAHILRRVLSDYGVSGVSDIVIRRALADMYAVTQKYWMPEPDAHETLDWLRQKGYRLGLISNASDDADVQTLLDNAGLRSYFDLITTSAAQGVRKPNPQIFWTALNTLGMLPSRAAMVGDTLGADILGAQNSGIYSIWITQRADSPANQAHADTIHPDATIHTLSELPGLLTRLDSESSL